MKTILTTAGIFTLVFGAGLLTAGITEDYSHSTNFAQFHTFHFLKVDAANPLWTSRIKRDIAAELTAKGWKEEPNGQVAVSAMGRTRQEQSYNTFYDGLGGGWMWGGDNGFSTTNVEKVPVGTLVVDMFNSQNKKLIWRAVATDTLSGSPEKNTKKLRQEIDKMFKKFPPSTKAES